MGYVEIKMIEKRRGEEKERNKKRKGETKEKRDRQRRIGGQPVRLVESSLTFSEARKWRSNVIVRRGWRWHLDGDCLSYFIGSVIIPRSLIIVIYNF